MNTTAPTPDRRKVPPLKLRCRLRDLPELLALLLSVQPYHHP